MATPNILCPMLYRLSKSVKFKSTVIVFKDLEEVGLGKWCVSSFPRDRVEWLALYTE